MSLKRTVQRIAMPAALALAAASVFTACGGPEAEVDPVVLKVGDRTILLSELQGQLDYWVESGSALPVSAEQFVERYTERAIALEKARELGLDQDPALRSQWESMLIGRLRAIEMEAALAEVIVASDDVEAYYQENIANYTREAQARVALLYLPYAVKGESARAAVHQRLEEARAKAAELAEGSRGFGPLAPKYSDEATSRFKGGDVGWMQAGRGSYRWPEPVVQTAFRLTTVGEISSVIETEEGAYLIMLMDSRPAKVQPLEAVSTSIHRELTAQAREHAAQNLQAAWGQGRDVTTFPEALNQLSFPTAELASVADEAPETMPAN